MSLIRDDKEIIRQMDNNRDAISSYIFYKETESRVLSSLASMQVSTRERLESMLFIIELRMMYTIQNVGFHLDFGHYRWMVGLLQRHLLPMVGYREVINRISQSPKINDTYPRAVTFITKMYDPEQLVKNEGSHITIPTQKKKLNIQRNRLFSSAVSQLEK